MATVDARQTIGWDDVEREIRRLADSGDNFETTLAGSNRIANYVPGWRIGVENDRGLRWIDIATIKTCWETFERLGRISRSDVLEPGRSSAFMMALFACVQGVRSEALDELYLVLPRD